MDEDMMKNKAPEEMNPTDPTTNATQEDEYGTQYQKTSIFENIKAILVSPEGAFLVFVLSNLLGYAVYAFTRNGYEVKVKTGGGTEVAVAKAVIKND